MTVDGTERMERVTVLIEIEASEIDYSPTLLSIFLTKNRADGLRVRGEEGFLPHLSRPQFYRRQDNDN